MGYLVLLLDINWVITQCVFLYLLADFVGGIFHWAEDTLGDIDTPIWGPIFVAPNVVHHELPAEMMQKHWFLNNLPNWLGAAGIAFAVWVAGWMTWQFALFAVFGAFNQQAHRFAHARSVDLVPSIKLLQKHGVLQSARHHWRHHTDPHTTNYCVMTPWVNPLLDRIRFWRGMERVFVPVFGAPRRKDLKANSWYRA